MKENYKAHYLALLAENKLNDGLLSMDHQMNDRYEVLVKQLMEKRNINEKLKEEDRMRWVHEMNNIRNFAEKSVIKEIIKINRCCKCV